MNRAGFQRAAGGVHAAAHLADGIPDLLNALHRRASTLRGPVQVIETAGDFRGKRHDDAAASSTLVPSSIALSVVPATTASNFLAPASSTLNPSEIRKSLSVSAFIVLSPFRYAVIVIGFEVQPVIHAGNIGQVD
jgi:hypothetical protein